MANAWISSLIRCFPIILLILYSIMLYCRGSYRENRVMTIWTVLYSTSDDDDAQLQQIEIEASDKREARKIAADKCPTGFSLSDIAKKRGNHGGKREGAGQPSKHGERTKALRLPESLVSSPEKVDQILTIPQLQELLDEWEKDCEDNPKSVRRHFLRQALQDIRALGY